MKHIDLKYTFIFLTCITLLLSQLVFPSKRLEPNTEVDYFPKYESDVPPDYCFAGPSYDNYSDPLDYSPKYADEVPPGYCFPGPSYNITTEFQPIKSVRFAASAYMQKSKTQNNNELPFTTRSLSPTDEYRTFEKVRTKMLSTFSKRQLSQLDKKNNTGKFSTQKQCYNFKK